MKGNANSLCYATRLALSNNSFVIVAAADLNIVNDMRLSARFTDVS